MIAVDAAKHGKKDSSIMLIYCHDGVCVLAYIENNKWKCPDIHYCIFCQYVDCKFFKMIKRHHVHPVHIIISLLNSTANNFSFSILSVFIFHVHLLHNWATPTHQVRLECTPCFLFSFEAEAGCLMLFDCNGFSARVHRPGARWGRNRGFVCG